METEGKPKQWRRCHPRLGRTGCYHYAELFPEKGMCGLLGSVLWLLCARKKKKPEPSMPAVSLPICPLGSISSSAFRGERTGRNQVSTTFWPMAPNQDPRAGSLWLCLAPGQPCRTQTLSLHTGGNPGSERQRTTQWEGSPFLSGSVRLRAPPTNSPWEGIKAVNSVGIAS